MAELVSGARACKGRPGRRAAAGPPAASPGSSADLARRPRPGGALTLRGNQTPAGAGRPLGLAQPHDPGLGSFPGALGGEQQQPAKARPASRPLGGSPQGPTRRAGLRPAAGTRGGPPFLPGPQLPRPLRSRAVPLRGGRRRLHGALGRPPPGPGASPRSPPAPPSLVVGLLPAPRPRGGVPGPGHAPRGPRPRPQAPVPRSRHSLGSRSAPPVPPWKPTAGSQLREFLGAHLLRAGVCCRRSPRILEGAASHSAEGTGG